MFGLKNSGKTQLNARDVAEATAIKAIDLLCSRKITAVQYAEALLERIEKLSCVNGFAFVDSKKVNGCFPQKT